MNFGNKTTCQVYAVVCVSNPREVRRGNHLFGKLYFGLSLIHFQTLY